MHFVSSSGDRDDLNLSNDFDVIHVNLACGRKITQPFANAYCAERLTLVTLV